VKSKLLLLLLASSLFVLGLALSFGFVSPMVSGWELKNSLMATYGVSTPQQFTELTGLTLNVPTLPDFNVISMQLNAFSMLFFVVVSFFGGKIKRQVTKTVLVLLVAVFAAGFLVGVEYSRAVTPTYTIEPEGLLPKAYDYIVYVSGSTYYRINGADSTVTSGTDDDTIIQTALNQNKSVIIKAGSYSASVTFKGGRLIIDKGATGVTYSIDSGASGTIEDYNDGEIKHYVSGSLMFRMDMQTGQISGLSWLNSTSLKFTDEFWYGADNRTDTLAYPEQAASYIVFGDDTDGDGVADVVYAKNCTTGQIEFGGSWNAGGVDGANVSAVIQTVIDSFSSGGTVIMKEGIYDFGDSNLTFDGFDVTKPLTFICKGTLRFNSGSVKIGSSESVSYSRFYFHKIEGTGKTADGIVINRGSHLTVNFDHIYNCRCGINITTVNYCGANDFYGNAISSCSYAINLFANAYNLEGNRFFMNFIQGCNKGIYIPTATAPYACSNNIFIGHIDNAGVAGSTDIEEYGGTNMYILHYIRWSAVTLHSGSAAYARTRLYMGDIVQAGVPQNGDKGVLLWGGGGSIDIWRGDGIPYVDFKTNYTTDYDARISKTSDHGLDFRVGGEGSIVVALKIRPDGRVEPLHLVIPTTQPSNPVAGSIYFVTTTNTLYIYNGTAWVSVTLTG